MKLRWAGPIILSDLSISNLIVASLRLEVYQIIYADKDKKRKEA